MKHKLVGLVEGKMSSDSFTDKVAVLKNKLDRLEDHTEVNLKRIENMVKRLN